MSGLFMMISIILSTIVRFLSFNKNLLLFLLFSFKHVLIVSIAACESDIIFTLAPHGTANRAVCIAMSSARVDDDQLVDLPLKEVFTYLSVHHPIPINFCLS